MHVFFCLRVRIPGALGRKAWRSAGYFLPKAGASRRMGRKTSRAADKIHVFFCLRGEFPGLWAEKRGGVQDTFCPKPAPAAAWAEKIKKLSSDTCILCERSGYQDCKIHNPSTGGFKDRREFLLITGLWREKSKSVHPSVPVMLRRPYRF